MGSVGTYLNFNGTAEEAMNWYAQVFESEITSITRYGDFAGGEGIPEHAKNAIMNSQMIIMGSYLLQASDHLAEFGGPLVQGNSMAIVLMPDSRAETDRLFGLLSVGGQVRQAPADMGFGYFSDFVDQFGVNWMFFNAAE